MDDMTGGFDRFFDDHYDPVVRAMSLITRDRARAEDAVQEAFATAYRKWPTVSRLDRPSGWVVVVATNNLKRWFTTEERRLNRFESAGVARTDDGTMAGGSARDHAPLVVASTSLRDALAALPPRQRATVVLRYLEDLPTEDVAKALGCSPGTVKSALHSALRSLRIELADADLPDSPLETDPTTGSPDVRGLNEVK